MPWIRCGCKLHRTHRIDDEILACPFMCAKSITSHSEFDLGIEVGNREPLALLSVSVCYFSGSSGHEHRISMQRSQRRAKLVQSLDFFIVTKKLSRAACASRRSFRATMFVRDYGVRVSSRHDAAPTAQPRTDRCRGRAVKVGLTGPVPV
jgi:hypothetical protein